MIHIRARVRFNSAQVKKEVNTATFRSLGQAAGAIRLTAKRSIRKRKKPSNPGSPPGTRTGMLRRVLRYEVDRDREQAVVGPVDEIAGRLWNLHEFGGVAKTRRKLKRHRFRVGQYGPIRIKSPGKFARTLLLYELLRLEISLRLISGETPDLSEYNSRFPDKTTIVEQVFQSNESGTPKQLDLTATSDHGSGFTADTPPQTDSPMPEFFGRYRVEELLGKGGFGAVYRAIDEQLKRAVAVKITFKRFVAAGGEDAFLAEARTVASLDHPRMVPVYDVGQSAEGDYFVVSKLIDGRDLAHLLASERPSRITAIEIVSAIADALHYAHTRGLVHRDVKPANILIDQHGNAYLADFGIALREQDLGQGAGYVGTPAYMSPEQARGEGHRVDGRSDIYGLGVVIDETLTGRRPFQAPDAGKLLEQISRSEVRPPRQLDDTCPSELERICLKSLALRASDRYSTARDLADDLQAFSASLTTLADRTATAVTPGKSPQPVATPTPTGPTKIVPKGLRSFDKDDADFFLELLPGPCDRTGLPESLRFWKRQIEAGSDDDVFNIGLIYGSSGCGKSSLMKAGLLPRLSADVIPVYIEATSDDTESSLARGIQKKLPALPSDRGLKELLTAVRRGQGLAVGQKTAARGRPVRAMVARTRRLSNRRTHRRAPPV